jgi:acetyl esterase/lipase
MSRIARGFAAACVAGLLLTGCTQQAPTADGTAVTSVSTDKDVVYRTVDGQQLPLESCIPQPTRSAPALVIVHGGGFQNGTRTDLDFVCQQAAMAGMATFSVDYRLLPARYPAQVQDVAAAIDWLGRDAQRKRFSLAKDRVAVLGASAGAVIAAELATGTSGSPLEPGTLRGAVLLSGLYDANGTLGELAPVADQYLGCTAGSAGCDATRTKASAVDAVSADDPPMLLVGSTSELSPLPQLTGFAAALQKAGVEHETIVVPGDAHAEAVLVTKPDTVPKVLAFLRKVLVTAD